MKATKDWGPAHKLQFTLEDEAGNEKTINNPNFTTTIPSGDDKN